MRPKCRLGQGLVENVKKCVGEKESGKSECTHSQFVEKKIVDPVSVVRLLVVVFVTLVK